MRYCVKQVHFIHNITVEHTHTRLTALFPTTSLQNYKNIFKSVTGLTNFPVTGFFRRTRTWKLFTVFQSYFIATITNVNKQCTNHSTYNICTHQPSQTCIHLRQHIRYKPSPINWSINQSNVSSYSLISNTKFSKKYLVSKHLLNMLKVKARK